MPSGFPPRCSPASPGASAQELGIPVLCSLQGEDTFLDSLPEPWRSRSWETLAERARDIAAFVAPSRFYAGVMGPRMRLRAEQLRVIPNGISLEGLAPRRKPARRQSSAFWRA